MITLTPNRRLALFLKAQYDQHQKEKKLQSWESLVVEPLSEWLNEQVNVDNCLSSLQRQIVWERIILESDYSALIKVQQTAKVAINAWQLLWEWDIPLKKIAEYAKFSPDIDAFYTWAETYKNWLAENNYTDLSLSLVSFASNLEKNTKQEIILNSIDELSILQKKIFKNFPVKYDNALVEPKQLLRTEFKSIEAELRTAAQWALDNYTSGKMIAVVLPDLVQKRQLVTDIFYQLIPEDILNISAPSSLGAYGLIDNAMSILQLSADIIKYEDFSRLLRKSNPILDRKLRSKVAKYISWKDLIELLPEDMRDCYQKHYELIKLKPQLQNAQFWVKYITDILNNLSWPGDSFYTKEELDLYSCWKEVLQEYIEISLIIGEHDFFTAIKYIKRIIIETPFLPSEKGKAPIQVLGLLEAAGIPFEKIWITGMSSDNWPTAANPNPFIPIEIQIEKNIPRSSHNRELEVAKRLTRVLCGSGNQQVIFSFAQNEDHNLQISSLLRNILYKEFPVAKIMETRIILEKYSDQYGTKKFGDIKGGSKVLELQEQCPFAAFASIRLELKNIESPESILSPMHRGAMVHAILEKFWLEIKDKSNLTSQIENIPKIIEKYAALILLQWKKRVPQILTEMYCKLEQHRLVSLINKWLEFELERQDFKVVAVEDLASVTLGPLRFNLRVDRIDHTKDGYHVVDYKTGTPNSNKQLQMYSLLDYDIKSVEYAIIKPDQIRVVKKQVEEQWRTDLEFLAEEFSSGYAAVNPKTQQICINCDFHALCRVQQNDI